MRSFPKLAFVCFLAGAAVVLLFGAGLLITARGDASGPLQEAESGSRAENALYRRMPMPGGEVLARRPPREARPLLDQLVNEAPLQADLYSLRALQEEQQLDFAAAESDWKGYAQRAADRAAGQLALADFYHRRLRPQEEIEALSVVAQAGATANESLLAPVQQQSWNAFKRISDVIAESALPAATSDAQYRVWIARYPAESYPYAGYFEFLLEQKEYDRAGELIASYHRAFPQDAVFPVKARALLEYRKGDVAQGLAVYDRAFDPNWPQELVRAYFDLLRETRHLRAFLDASSRTLAAHPEDLNSMARVFYYQQQNSKPDAARRVIDEFRRHKDAAKSPWTGEELSTIAHLLEQLPDYSEAARYDCSLYTTTNSPEDRERALTALINLLLVAPEQPIRLGAGDLSMYKDIGAMDPGPGFLNGILSLLFNSTSVKEEFAAEDARAAVYFHRAEAARLLAILDAQFPHSAERAALHARLLQVYAEYGESETVIRRAREFLAAFPAAVERTQVSLLMADAFARLNRPDDEFAVYDSVLRELAQEAHGVPLGSQSHSSAWQSQTPGQLQDAANDEESAPNEQEAGGNNRAAVRRSFLVTPAESPATYGARSPDYAAVLNRYLARLASLSRVPAALSVLRREVDNNPNDPGLYERLAQFLDQNQLGAQVEQVYKRAIHQFPDRSWYHTLARWYLRQRRNAEYEALSEEVVKIFWGSELESYFRDTASETPPQLYLRLNLYANRRFPHDLVFVQNLLMSYHRQETYNEAAWIRLLNQHWFEDDNLRAEMFDYLSRRGLLERELDAIRSDSPDMRAGRWTPSAEANPVAVQFFAYAEEWRSHFENASPALAALAAEFPADASLGREASSLCRSLAYEDARHTGAAVHIEENLLQANPRDAETLARVGDIFAERDLLARAAPYWNRMAELEPGKASSYLEAASVFWDYYQFDDALRLLNEGRRKIADPALFAYEEGAIYEGKRDTARAVEEYVKGALAGGEETEAGQRLLSLARRPRFASQIDAATARLAEARNPEISAIRLRVRVLDSLNRKSEVKAFLLGVLDRTSSLELAEDVDALAQAESYDEVRARALVREAALTTDPVHRLELQYALAQQEESRGDIAGAQQSIESIYRENPKLLGVVRATTDFYWRQKSKSRAIEVLIQAAKDANSDLRGKFQFEAGRKATDAGNYALARQLVEPLLQESPYDGAFLAAMADTYARAGDDTGLRDFYLSHISLLRQAKISAAERDLNISTLRRGLIPALTRLNDFAGAVDQYIEILNQFPEDEALATEAALFAAQHGRQRQLVAYYEKTIAASPRDFRWPMILARVQTELGDAAAAVAAYDKAIAVRADRTDLFAARADLLERLQRFDDAANDDAKLYLLSYHDSKWLVKVAETRARQGRVEEAVKALKAAYVDGCPVSPDNFFEVARTLESWGMLPQAADFAAQGVQAAGDSLLADSENHSGAQIYTRILTRQRRQQEAYMRLEFALASASSSRVSLTATVKQVEQQGLAAVTGQQWRERQRAVDTIAGRRGWQLCMREMGDGVARYFTPGERTAFAQFLEEKGSAVSNADLEELLLPAAEAAGLAELEAQWRNKLMLSVQSDWYAEMSALVALQSRRLKFGELADQLETLVARVPRDQRGMILRDIAEAFRADGDSANELRVLTQMDQEGWLSSNEPRYFELLFERQRDSLARQAGSAGEMRRDAATNFAVSSGDAKLAYDAVRARGAGLAPVWTSAYTGLTGLFYSDPAASVKEAFHSALDDRSIGERVDKPADRAQVLAGGIWFYYASRYGEYLGVTHSGNPEDFLPAGLEDSPATPDAYLILAEYYARTGDLPRAIADDQHALDLSPNRAGVRGHLADLYWQRNEHERALAEWKQALEVLTKQAQSSGVAEQFWSDFSSVAGDLRERRLADQFKPQVDVLVRNYLRNNGFYRDTMVFRAAFNFLNDSSAATAWLLDLSSAAPKPDSVLEPLTRAAWIPPAQRELVFARILELKQAVFERSEGSQKEEAEEGLRDWQIRWLRFLIAGKQFTRARATLQGLPLPVRERFSTQLVPLDLRIATGEDRLESVLAGYRGDPDHAPPFELLRDAARLLEKAGNKSAAQKILEFAYSRQIEEHDLNAAAFLGLAEIRLDAGDVNGALGLLRRLTLEAGAPFENLDSAAALLERANHPAEAAVFLDQIVAASPWEPAFHFRLARAQIAAGKNVAGARQQLAGIAATSAAPYEVRADAAAALSGSAAAANFGSEELTLLSSTIAPDQKRVDKAFFTRARKKAAMQQADASIRITLLRRLLEDSPSDDEARIELFHAGVASERNTLAVSGIQPLLRYDMARIRQLYRPENGDDAQDDEFVEPGESDLYGLRAQLKSSLPGKTTDEKTQIAAELGLVMTKLDRVDDAAAYVDAARRLEPDAARRAALCEQLRQLEAQIRWRAQNESRRPLIHKDLDQDRLVHPRLAAPAASSNAGSASPAGGQR